MPCALAGALNGRIQGDCIAHIFTVNRVTAAGPDCTAASLCCVRALAPVCVCVCVCVSSCGLICSQQDGKEAKLKGGDRRSKAALLFDLL